jgi:1-aminocyclopropane-1-carboxylate deaminase
MQSLTPGHITIDKLPGSLFADYHVEIYIIRSDKIHPLISGNKWYKLQYYFEEARQQKKKRIVTFGGAWSNHVVAAAAAGRLNHFDTTAIIRGEEPNELSVTLKQAKEMGMQLIFISRDDYKAKKIPAELTNHDHYHIPEGGYGLKGAKGAAGILANCKIENYTHIICAVGTGTMMAGLINAALPKQQVIGISALKNNDELEENVKALLNDHKNNFKIIPDYHFGGYAKYTTELIDFMNEFYRQTGIPSDFVYTGKLFYAITDLTRKNFFPPGSKLLVIHSGGLQGNASLNKGTLIF